MQLPYAFALHTVQAAAAVPRCTYKQVLLAPAGTYVACCVHKLVEAEVHLAGALRVKRAKRARGCLQEQAGADVLVQRQAAEGSGRASKCE